MIKRMVVPKNLYMHSEYASKETGRIVYDVLDIWQKHRTRLTTEEYTSTVIKANLRFGYQQIEGNITRKHNYVDELILYSIYI